MKQDVGLPVEEVDRQVIVCFFYRPVNHFGYSYLGEITTTTTTKSSKHNTIYPITSQSFFTVPDILQSLFGDICLINEVE